MAAIKAVPENSHKTLSKEVRINILRNILIECVWDGVQGEQSGSDQNTLFSCRFQCSKVGEQCERYCLWRVLMQTQGVGWKRRCSQKEDQESSKEIGGRHHPQQFLHLRGQISFFIVIKGREQALILPEKAVLSVPNSRILEFFRKEIEALLASSVGGGKRKRKETQLYHTTCTLQPRKLLSLPRE